ncbi:hypothetical protein N8I77_008809 [Diaporthe amygdali]|uniref:Glucose-methanol-choline oxidoreductase N-terminal domain-containing protein n=1 Tax=Phomopsis amygdali TaxID=1214568 RepID=A0AAD9SA27_PHOAM|nr:hypothetical protein N8I77_008809 [Diaporthe amygdali]
MRTGPAAPDELKINVPAMFGSTQGGPYDWNFTTTPQPGLGSRVVDLSRGKVLGGSSAMNYMLWNRASAPEYDVWETLGNPDWNWDSMLAGMVKSENFTGIDSQDYGHVGRGTEGPIHNVINRYRTEQVQAWIPTLENLGLSHNLESLGGNPLGAMLQPSSVNPDNYTRSYSANSYLPRVGPNLALLLSTRVARINFDTPSKSRRWDRASHDDVVATGVTLEDGSVITARNEVIISAGSLQSPGILELSGIGQKSVLEGAGINQIIDLPGVGENLQDHVGVGVTYQLKPGYNSLDIFIYNATYAAEQLDLWENKHVSRYDYSISDIAFFNWKQLLGNDTAIVDLAVQAVGNSTNVIDQAKLSFLSDYAVPQMEMTMSDSTIGPTYPSPGDPLYESDFITPLGIVMRPLARGSVHIRSSNISHSPEIDPRYASNAYDLQNLVEAGKFARKIAQTEPLASLLVGEYAPGLAAVSTEDEWIEYAREAMITIYHYSGTCAMLPKKDGGVVDPRLKVWGTKNLRVVDASIIPVLMASHTQTAAYGIAERAAEIIIEDYKGL